MKRLFSILTIVMLVLCALHARAAEGLVNDDCGVLTDEEVAELESRLAKTADEYDFDPVIAIEPYAGGHDIVSYADDYFDYNGYGRGGSLSGVLMMICIGDNERYISTSGDCINAYTDEVIAYIGSDLAKSIDKGDYAGACRKFAKYSKDIMKAERAGKAYKIPFRPSGMGILIVLLISAIVTFIAAKTAKQSTREAVTPVDADIYAKGGSAEITKSRDFFLYSHVTRSEREESKSSSGGSATHTSSSGNTHGGGRF